MKLSAQLHKDNSGFTLVELLMVVGIIAVLSGFLVPGFSNYIDNQNLLQAQELVKNDLRTAQNRALTGVGSAVGTSFWGIKIPADNTQNYFFFSSAGATGADCDSVSEGSTNVQRSETLPGNTAVVNGSGVCVFFSGRNGDAVFANNGESDMLQIGYPGKDVCHAVQVNSVGMISGVNLCE